MQLRHSLPLISAALSFSMFSAQAQTNVFNSTGNVGIGTTNPAAHLHISGPTPSVLIQDTAGSGRTYSLSSRWGGYFTIFDEAVPSQPRLSITSVGNVGIGMTVPAFKLDVQNDNYNAIRATGSSTNSIGIYVQNTIPSGRQWALVSAGGALAPVGSFVLWDDTAGGPRVTVGPSGNVGIGTIDPAALLEVRRDTSTPSIGGRVAINNFASASAASVALDMSAANTSGLDPQTRIQTVDNSDWSANLLFLTKVPGNNANPLEERMRITSAGRVAIGTNAPLGRLHISGNEGGAYQRTSDIIIQRSSATNTTGKISFVGSGGLASSRWEIVSDADIGDDFGFSFNGIKRLQILNNGNVGIGTSNPGNSKLAVNGTIRSKEVVVDTVGWADYVFAEGYNLKPLSEVEQHIKQHKHLPGIPSAAEVAEKGVGVGEMQAKLLAKVEELTLHVIAQQKELQAVRSENSQLKARVTALESK